MPQPTEFAIQVTSEDPKKKKEKESDKEEGSSKALKDGKNDGKDEKGKGAFKCEKCGWIARKSLGPCFEARNDKVLEV